MRDRMTDAEVGQALDEGWNYLARRCRPGEQPALKPLNYDRARNRVKSYLNGHTPQYQSRTQAQITGELKRLGRGGR